MAPAETVTERTLPLPATAAAPQMARRHVAGVPGLGGRLGYEVLLLTSEVITFFLAEREPDPSARLLLTVRVTRDRVRVELSGPLPVETVERALRSRDSPSLGGYGLAILDRTAQRWGAERADGLTLWFELDR
ncbi:MAG: hypothetical protein MSC31_08320 [Solirubrobacteraceae bacterium MAG38_C4-C5]|nr:hypothetical protein [Candidatus Siliceabacter maunaloa]